MFELVKKVIKRDDTTIKTKGKLKLDKIPKEPRTKNVRKSIAKVIIINVTLYINPVEKLEKLEDVEKIDVVKPDGPKRSINPLSKA